MFAECFGWQSCYIKNKQLKNAVIVTDLWWDFVFVGLVLGWVWAFFFIFQT